MISSIIISYSIQQSLSLLLIKSFNNVIRNCLSKSFCKYNIPYVSKAELLMYSLIFESSIILISSWFCSSYELANNLAKYSGKSSNQFERLS